METSIELPIVTNEMITSLQATMRERGLRPVEEFDLVPDQELLRIDVTTGEETLVRIVEKKKKPLSCVHYKYVEESSAHVVIPMENFLRKDCVLHSNFANATRYFTQDSNSG